MSAAFLSAKSYATERRENVLPPPAKCVSVCVCVWQMASGCHKMLPYFPFFRFAATVGVSATPTLPIKCIAMWPPPNINISPHRKGSHSPSFFPSFSSFVSFPIRNLFFWYHFSVTPSPRPSFFINNHNSYLLMCSICF